MARPPRGGGKGPQPKKGQFTEHRVAWCRTAIAECVLMIYPPRDENKEPGPTVKVFIPQPGLRAVNLDLTHLTSEELKAMRKLFDMAFDRAEPIVRDRDRVASDAFDNGDDSYSRYYRQVPQFVDRSGKVPEYGEGVHDGHDDLPQSGGGAAAGADGVRGAGGDVADDEQEHSQSQDHEPKAD